MATTFAAGLVAYDFIHGAVREPKPRGSSILVSHPRRKGRHVQSHACNGVRINLETRWRVESFPKRDQLQGRGQSERIRASSRENEGQSPMELWPGASSPPDFEFGYQKAEEELQLDDTDSSTSAFSELIGSVVQPYMGDVEMLEEEELPAEYVPPPPISVEDVEMRNSVEEVMYMLLECIPGPMNALLHDQEKWDTLVRMFSVTVEVQDPLLCVKGLNSFERLLKVLCHSGIAVKLHDVYYESLAADKIKRWVYAVWTATLTNEVADNLEDSRNHNFKLSGESRFEVNKEGKVTSVSSRWYKLTEEDCVELADSKLWLADLYSKSGL
ncbi:hypothetical protein R1flu_011720 [Riccia fluitans]|uniref:Uncharacterized protein n=1 Tax=Riccia fluitans TaxID=41844 RepID=A0ABD1Z9P5_9MARC